MTSKINAYFFDGKSSTKHDCSITLHPKVLEIEYFDNVNQLNNTIRWKIEYINRISVKTSENTLIYGNFPYEIIEFKKTSDFDRVVGAYPNAGFHQSHYNKFLSFGWKGIVLCFLCVAVISVFLFQYGVPYVAEEFSKKIPKEYEAYIGKQTKNNFIHYYEIDSVKSTLIQDFFDELNFFSTYKINFLVLKSETANAFALPGGEIIILSAILEIIENEEELAALLAHELSHINERHALRTISRNLSHYLLLSIIAGDVGGFSSVLLEKSNLISSLSYSRKLEKEADIEGLKYIDSSNINPKGMISLFQKIENSFNDNQKQKDSTSTVRNIKQPQTVESDSSAKRIPDTILNIQEILSTHPTPINRINYIKEEIDLLNYKNYKSSPRLKVLFKELTS